MNFLNRLILAFLLLTGLAWGVGFLGAGQSLPAGISCLLAVFLIFRRWKGDKRWMVPGFLAYTALAAAGVFLKIDFGWNLLGFGGAIVVWDLSYFADSVLVEGSVRKQSELIRRHLLLLGISLIGGSALAALSVRTELGASFIWLVGLGAGLIAALRQLILYVEKVRSGD